MIREWDRVRPGDIVRYLPHDSTRVGTVVRVNDDAVSWCGSHYHGWYGHYRTRKLLVRWCNTSGREWASWVIDRNCEVIESPIVRLKAHLIENIAERLLVTATDETGDAVVEIDMLRPDDDSRPLRYYEV